VVDEAHHFGAEKLSTFLPQNIKYRLALSATLERYGDEIGTHKLFDYFGEKCIEYPLERAIKEGALVPYYYHPILVNLTDDELDEYKKLSKELTKYLVKKGKKVTVSESGKYIAFKRSRLVAGASNKLFELKKELVSHINETHILVYCGATSNRHGTNDEETERQILQVQKMIGIDLGMVTHKFTAEENAQQKEDIKKAFASGAYQVLTAIKCLDEGVNIPAIKTAYILASSQNPKEFIQRRGRVLRKSPETGKKFAIIYDFVTLPRPLENVIPEDYKSDKSLVSGEIIRMIEFAQHSLNEGEADSLIEEIKEAYGIDLFNGDDWEQEEEIYE
jgi:superfamily II DNA or RNA helicase